MKSEFKLQYILYLIIVLLLFFISSKLKFQFDFSKNKTYTLTEYTKDSFDSLTETCKIQWIRSKNLSKYVSSTTYIENLLNQIAQLNNSSLEIIDVETLSETAIQALQIYPEQITTGSLTEQSFITLYSAILLEYKGFSKTLPYVFALENLEYSIVNNLQSLIQDSEFLSEKRNVQIITSPLATQSDYIYVLPFLEYDNFICTILKDAEVKNLNPNYPLIVIGSTGLSNNSIAEIDAFLQAGGNAAFFVSGNTIDINGNWAHTPKTNDTLISLLANYGFIISSDILTDIFYFPLTLTSDDGARNELINYPYWVRINPEQISNEQNIFSNHETLQMFWPSSLDLNTTQDETLKPIITSSSQASRHVENIITDPFTFSQNTTTAEKGKYTLAATSTKRGRVFVLSDEYFLSRCIEFTNAQVNIQSLVSICHWLYGNEALLTLRKKQSTILPFRTFDDENIIAKTKAFSRFINILTVPITIIVVFFIVLFKTKKRK